MRTLVLVFLTAVSVSAQDVDLAVRPDTLYVENAGGNIVPMERLFFHIVIHNQGKTPIQVQWVRFDIVNSSGVVFSGQYSGNALNDLFDSAIERRRIEPTPAGTLTIGSEQRKAISDVFLDFPMGFIGENLLVEVDYTADGKPAFKKASIQLKRKEAFSGRLPFDGVWYVSAEHGFLDPHKRFLAEAFAYDFLQIGPNGKSFQRDGKANTDYFAYGKKVLAAKDGTVVTVRGDMAENAPAETTNTTTPGGNVVIIDHGNDQFGYYAHLKPFTVSVKEGARVRAGDVLGEVGNSGDSMEPHLHFHVMNHADPTQADGVPMIFDSWKAQSYSRVPATRQLGVLPRGEFVQP